MNTNTAEDEFNHIIDTIESRAMACDGPITPTLREATEDELSRLWHLLQEISSRRKAMNTKTAEEMRAIVRENIPRDCYWEEMDNLTNTPIKYIFICMEEYASPLKKENENLKSCMIAAAEEIMKVWPAHCDDEGYGPSNLMHRLEKGIPAQYGYKAGDFEVLKKRIEELEAALTTAILFIDKDEYESYVKDLNETLNPSTNGK